MYREARGLMTGDINAAVEGAVAAGAQEVIVYDMHSGGINLILDQLHRRATVIAGEPPQFAHAAEQCSGMFLVGFHGMAGTPGGLLTHTYQLEIKAMFLNGKLTGEVGMECALAGALGIPCVMLSGDSKAVAEAQELLEDVETACVKEAISYESAVCAHPALAQERIRRAAEDAVNRISDFKPIETRTPAELRIEYYSKAPCDRIASLDGVERVNEVTASIREPSLLAAWRKYEEVQLA